MKVLITDSNDYLAWYSKYIGRAFEFISEDGDFIKTKEPSGYVNFVPKDCCKLIESNDDIKIDITFDLLLKGVTIGNSIYNVKTSDEGFTLSVVSSKITDRIDLKAIYFNLGLTYDESRFNWEIDSSKIYHLICESGFDVPKWLFEQ